MAIEARGVELLVQSDLDVIVAKFDSHVKNISRIYAAGILSRGFAIVFSKPGLGACKKDMRFYVRDLSTRVKIDDTEMKRQALGSLYQEMADDERYVKIVVENDEFLYVLMEFFYSSEMEIQEHASKIVSFISV
ncbi:hypothetical protein F3Y22_tig00110796pilonHSYRG00018 [Hibiscus syriacus]|uniref:DUF7032 domain-containing protein n=1 Tax=Hibiscus syriacus TaxID=106335 RepID=A0A6A2ZR55_HIBSY|nr:hypothetical protein F3Y22_tig00110796pilonHSYRG00018 [Hibiscus syriacus]